VASLTSFPVILLKGKKNEKKISREMTKNHRRVGLGLKIPQFCNYPRNSIFVKHFYVDVFIDQSIWIIINFMMRVNYFDIKKIQSKKVTFCPHKTKQKYFLKIKNKNTFYFSQVFIHVKRNKNIS
jgi:hypothetical protein